MTRPKRNPGDSNSNQAETAKGRKRYRFELSSNQFWVSCFCMVFILSWMFILGVLVGRGIPLIDSTDVSLRAQFLRFIGLGKQVAPPPPNIAETWENPKKMLESLSYYEDLTKKNGPSTSTEKTSSPVAGSVSKAPSNELSNQKPKPEPASAEPAKPTAQAPPKDPAAPGPAGEHFTLLVSSLRDIENAQRLIEQLRTKGYSPRLDSLDLSESGRWNRVLVGSFRSREEAMRFAAEFNRKERMEGLVIRETD